MANYSKRTKKFYIDIASDCPPEVNPPMVEKERTNLKGLLRRFAQTGGRLTAPRNDILLNTFVLEQNHVLGYTAE